MCVVWLLTDWTGLTSETEGYLTLVHLPFILHVVLAYTYDDAQVQEPKAEMQKCFFMPLIVPPPLMFHWPVQSNGQTQSQ